MALGDIRTASFIHTLNGVSNSSLGYITGGVFSPEGNKLFLTTSRSSWSKILCLHLNSPFAEFNNTWSLRNVKTAPKFHSYYCDLQSIAFSPDGYQIYLSYVAAEGVIRQWTLSAPYDITSTWTYVGQSGSYLYGGVVVFENSVWGLKSPYPNDYIREHNMYTPWTISSLQDKVQKEANITTQEDSPEGLKVSALKDRVYIAGRGSDRIHQWDLSTPGDLSSLDLSSHATLNSGINPKFCDISTDGHILAAQSSTYNVNIYSMPYPYTPPAFIPQVSIL